MLDRRPQKRNHNYTPRPSASQLKASAAGRWTQILTDLGIPKDCLDGRGHPCPRCGGRDRFAAFRDVADRGVVHCRKCFHRGMKITPSDGLSSIQWCLGSNFSDACKWLEVWLGYGVQTKLRMRKVASPVNVTPNVHDDRMRDIASQSVNAIDQGFYERLAKRLRLTTESLQRLRVGHLAKNSASTWPMQDANGEVIGIRLRSFNSSAKWSVKGSRAGLFVPADLARRLRDSDRLFICEGATDTAAIIGTGHEAIGLPSATSGMDYALELVRKLGPLEVICVADNDDAGLESSRSLAGRLLRIMPFVRMITPPGQFKDVREWIASCPDNDRACVAVANAADSAPSIMMGVMQ